MAYRPKNTQERILHRLKISKGHLEKVIEMVDQNEYCIHIIHQLQAIEEGLRQTGNLILDNHLRTCTSNAIKAGKKDEAIREIMEVFEKKK